MARRGVAVVRVEPGSPAHRAGVRAGHRLLSVDGQPIRDALDFQWFAAGDTVTLELESPAREICTRVRRDAHEGIGIELAAPRWRACRNKCVFCFIDQLPPGLRKSLYFKDEDYRLSFLNGSYVTLTDVDEDDIRRILTQRLSPLYVSVHATDHDLRRSLLGRPSAAPVLPLLGRLTAGGIRVHAQVVLCPGINDDAELDETVGALAALHPGVTSLAVVPVGLTAHRQGLPSLKTVERFQAAAVLDQVDRWGKTLLRTVGSRFVHASDEFYLLAGRSLPSASHYEGFPQVEDGVGMARTFVDRVRRGLRRVPQAARRKLGTGKCVITGKLAAPLLSDLLEETRTRVIEVPNLLLGGGVTVSGLLAGSDIIAATEELPRAEELLLPSNLLDSEGRLLDDWTPARLSEGLGARVRILPFLGRGLVSALGRP